MNKKFMEDAKYTEDKYLILEKPSIKSGQENNIVPSQFYQEYKRQISGIALSRKEIQQKLAQNGIKYRPYEYQQFKYEITQALLDYSILKVNVKLVHFSLDLYVLNESITSPIAELDKNIDGRYGEIYLLKYLDDQIAIKSVLFSLQYNFGFVFGEIVKEVCLMKICSILGCSVKMERYLGFDLIVYNDCIQFAMEKGEVEEERDEINRKDKMKLLALLKDQLALMHSFNIVHCDIKPDNIIFCQSQNKYVFIDFGLAQVLSEDRGFKSKTKFKGTPQLTSQEMFAIIVSRNKHYVDLYYNDMFGLKESIKHKLEENYQKQSCLIQQNKNMTSKILAQYLFYDFKFNYLSHNLAKLNHLLMYNNNFLLNCLNKKLLMFIKGIYRKIFIPEIFKKYFGCYQITAQYKFIEKLTKTSIETIIYSQNNVQEERNQDNLFYKRYLQIGIKDKSIYHQSANFQLLFDYLVKNINKKETLLIFGSMQIMFEILLECLRFDKINLKFDKKVQLSALFLPVMGCPKQQSHKQSIEDIKSIFKTMVEYLLKPELTKWKLQTGFEVFSQLIILDTNISSQLMQFVSQAQAKCFSIQDKFILGAELENICALIQLKNKTSQNGYLVTIQCDFFAKAFYLVYQIQNSKPKNQLQASLIYLSNLILVDRGTNNDQRQFCQLVIPHIQNLKLKKIVLRMWNNSKMIFQLKNQNNQNFFEHSKLILRQSKESQNLMTTFAFIAPYLSLFNLLRELKQLEKSISSMIDCQQIYQTFKIEYYLFLYNRQDTNSQFLGKYFYHFQQNLKAMTQSKLMSQSIQIQLDYFMIKIKNNHQFIQQNQHKIRQIYFKYIDQITGSIYNIIIIYFELEFIKILPELRESYFCKRIAYFNQRYPSSMQVNLENPPHPKLLVYLTLDYYWLIYKSQSSPQISNLQLLKHLLCLSYQTGKLLGQFMALSKFSLNILELLIRTQKLKEATYYIEQVGGFLKKNSSFGFYLHTNKRHLLALIFFIYNERQQYQKIYCLLFQLIKWIHKNPVKECFHILFINLENLYRLRKDIFKFANLSERLNSTKLKLITNPIYALLFIFTAEQNEIQSKKIKILRLISGTINNLPVFAKQYLLKRYYTIMTNLSIISMKKRLFIIKFSQIIDKNISKYLLTSKKSHFNKSRKNTILNIHNKNIFRRLRKINDYFN